jgi:outer membrane protein
MKLIHKSYLTTAITILFLGLMTSQILAKRMTIAVVKDGPSAEDKLIPLIEEELKLLAGKGTQVLFKETANFDAQWDLAEARQVVINALLDREVNIILAIGSLVTQAAAKPDLKLTKPFISSYVQRADIPKLPYSAADRSLKKNFNVVVIPQRAERDIRAFQELIPFKCIHVGLGKEEENVMTDIRSSLKVYEDSLGMKIFIVPISEDIPTSLSSMEGDVEAFYLTRIPRLPQEERIALINELNSRKIATFSMVGHSDVEIGALAALTPDITKKVVRRVALNLNQVIRGEAVNDLPVFLTVDTKLVINGRTAIQIGYSPSIKTKAFATFINEEALRSEEEVLTLAKAMEKAEIGNTSLSIQETTVETVQRDMQRSRSLLLPQINTIASYFQTDPRIEGGIIPEKLSSAGVTLSQIIYDDRVMSDYRSSKRFYDASQFEREAIRLDVLAEAGTAFLNFVLTQILYEIEADNLRLTEDNLELSRLRYDVGYSGKDEVFRWEAELAQRRAGLLFSESDFEAQRINLNQVLGIEQDIRWQPQEINLDPDVFYFLNGRINAIFKNSADWIRFREFLVQASIQNSPNIKLIENAIEAQEIQVGQRNRRWYLPRFFANLSYDYWFDITPELPTGVDKGTYQFSVSASYPLFEGARRVYDAQREKAVLEGLSRELKLAKELVEKVTRTAVRDVENSFPTIKFAQIAADNSLKNLNVVQDKYSQGIVNVTDLLEAQNQNFTSDQNAAATVYNFMKNLVTLQRAISWFEADKTAEEREDFLQRAEAAIAIQ